MKNSIHNVIVEYKNKRARKANVSLWGDIDLKSIAREIEADGAQTSVDNCTQPYPSKSTQTKTETKVLEAIPHFADDDDKVEDKRETSAIVVVQSEQAMVVPDLDQKPDVSKKAAIRNKVWAARADMNKGIPQYEKTNVFALMETDTHAELLLLESENSSLKRQLIFKIRSENDELRTMLKRAEQRETHQ